VSISCVLMLKCDNSLLVLPKEIGRLRIGSNLFALASVLRG
jgi:hypothetical protein